MFRRLENTPLDSIMLANYEWPEFKLRHKDAINTTIGVLVDPETGAIWRPASVTRAREQALRQISDTKQFGYQQMHGNDQFLVEANRFVFGDQPDDTYRYQTSGGTGALALVSEVLSYLLDSDKPELILDSGWPNHDVIFRNFDLKTYQHIDSSGSYNHGQLLQLIDDSAENSALLLQVSGYNGDGIDRTPAEWDEIIARAKAKNMVLILDAAYIGLVRSVAEDAYPIRAAYENEVLTFASVSFSKNMGLYNERLGALLLIGAQSCLSDDQANNLDSVVNKVIRRTVSSQPLLVAVASANALQDKVFTDELAIARKDLARKRAQLADLLEGKFPVIGKGFGLFTKLYEDGFTDDQFHQLREQGVLALRNSRINIGGLKFDQVEKLGLALRDL